MELDFRAKIILWLVSGILVIALVAGGLWWFLRARKSGISGSPGGQTQGASSVAKPLPSPSVEDAKIKLPRESVESIKKQTSVAVVAREFVERFGSFSPDSHMANFDEVKPLATASFAAWMEGYKQQALAGLPSDVVGITTRFVSLKTLSQDAAHQSLEVATQREENLGSSKRVYYQRILVKLALESDTWKVDAAYWQTKE